MSEAHGGYCAWKHAAQGVEGAHVVEALSRPWIEMTLGGLRLNEVDGIGAYGLDPENFGIGLAMAGGWFARYASNA